MENLNDQPPKTEIVPERSHQARGKVPEKQLIGLNKGFIYRFAGDEKNVSGLILLGDISFYDSSCLRRRS